MLSHAHNAPYPPLRPILLGQAKAVEKFLEAFLLFPPQKPTVNLTSPIEPGWITNKESNRAHNNPLHDLSRPSLQTRSSCNDVLGNLFCNCTISALERLRDAKQVK